MVATNNNIDAEAAEAAMARRWLRHNNVNASSSLARRAYRKLLLPALKLLEAGRRPKATHHAHR